MKSLRARLLAFDCALRSRGCMTKSELRRELRALTPLAPDVAALKSHRLCSRLADLREWRPAKVIALYAANAHEPDLSPLWEQKADRVFCFPRVEGQGLENERLAFYRVDSTADLLLSRWGLHEPPADPARLIDSPRIDLVIVPGVAFTANGDRLGRGRGHYDRFLATLRPTAAKIGICFAERLMSELPVEPHDRTLDRVLAE